MWAMELSAWQSLQAASKRELSSVNADSNPILTISKGVARIDIVGVLTDSRSILAMLFGGGNATYMDIIDAVDQVEATPSVKRVEYYFNSPGGQASASWFAAMDAIYNAKKPSKAIVVGMAASAAYGLASQADELVCMNRGCSVGSIGVVSQYSVDKDTITLTSTDAPNKAPDPSTEEGVKVIKERLDSLHAQFVEAVARGRGVSVETVNAQFGRGSVYLTDKAMSLGMVDNKKQQQETVAMDMATLEKEHPELCALLREQGAKSERERVQAHTTMGEACGNTEIAMKYIKSGDGLTALAQAEYLAAGMNRKDSDKRQGDDVRSGGDRGDRQGDTVDAIDQAAAALAKLNGGV